MWTESPLIKVWVNRPNVEVIHVSTEKGLGWKLDGFQGDKHVSPDEFQDRFEWIVHKLAQYVDETSVWKNADTGMVISAWEAMTLLTKDDNQDDE